MWQKEDYQEHMLGYLDGVRVEFEQLAYSDRLEQDLRTFYVRLDITLSCLWALIESNDVEWEEYRYALEASYDAMRRTFYPVQYTDSLSYSPSLVYAS